MRRVEKGGNIVESDSKWNRGTGMGCRSFQGWLSFQSAH